MQKRWFLLDGHCSLGLGFMTVMAGVSFLSRSRPDKDQGSPGTCSTVVPVSSPCPRPTLLVLLSQGVHQGLGRMWTPVQLG